MQISQEVKDFIRFFGTIGDLGTYDETGDYDSDEVEEWAQEHLSNIFPRYNFGASKLVFISDKLDQVVKIPFLGYYHYREDEEYGNELQFYKFKNANSEFGDNYCEAECRISEAAIEAGFSNFFALIELAGYSHDNHPIYVQEKVTWTEEEMHNLPEADEHSKAEAKQLQESYREDMCISPAWLSRAVDWYGKEEVENFIKWCINYDSEILADLHCGNVGYMKNGQPVIFDYSGFSDAENM